MGGRCWWGRSVFHEACLVSLDCVRHFGPYTCLGTAAQPRLVECTGVRQSQHYKQRLHERVFRFFAPDTRQDVRQARIQGVVVLKALIDTNGDVKEFSLVSGHPLLAPAALEAVKQWKYQPY